MAHRVDAIRNFSKPETQKQLRLFLGCISFYRRFIKDIATILQPLYNMLCGRKNSNKRLKMDERNGNILKYC